MVRFKTTTHSIQPGVKIVEIWVGSKMVATIYPQEPNGIRVISNHQLGVPPDISAITEFYFNPNK